MGIGDVKELDMEKIILRVLGWFLFMVLVMSFLIVFILMGQVIIWSLTLTTRTFATSTSTNLHSLETANNDSMNHDAYVHKPKLNRTEAPSQNTFVSGTKIREIDSNKAIEACHENVNRLSDQPVCGDPLPSYSDPKGQIIYKIKAVDGRLSLSPRCMEYQIEKPTVNVLECNYANKAFLDTLITLSRLGGVSSFECNYTLQLVTNFIESSAIWTNESCKAVMKNGETYHEITQATFRGEVRTMDNQNFARVREDMGKWCECLKMFDSSSSHSTTGMGQKFDNYSSNDQNACLDIIGARNHSRAFIKGKGVRGACNPGEVMLSRIPWKE